MVTAADAYLDRATGVVLARLRGPKARRGTRHWSDRAKSVDSGYHAGGKPTPAHIGPRNGSGVGVGPVVETKALDPGYVVPDSLVAETIDQMRPVALRVAADAATDVATRVRGGADDAAADGMFEVNHELLTDLIDEALEDMLGTAERYASELRRAILDGERDELPLDDLLRNVEEAARRGGNWLRLNARTVGIALAGKAALEQAKALGVTHAQWLSRRDGRVRPSHVTADGQVRPIGDSFRVGRFRVEYPGDPSGLPATAPEVHNCRCALLFADVDDAFYAALSGINAAALAEGITPGAESLLAATAASVVYGPGPGLGGLDDMAAMTTTPADVTGWRLLDTALDIAPGQQLALPAGTVFALAPPADAESTALAVLVPAGTLVGVTDDILTLAESAAVQVLAVGAAGIQGRLVA